MHMCACSYGKYVACVCVLLGSECCVCCALVLHLQLVTAYLRAALLWCCPARWSSLGLPCVRAMCQQLCSAVVWMIPMCSCKQDTWHPSLQAFKPKALQRLPLRASRRPCHLLLKLLAAKFTPLYIWVSICQKKQLITCLSLFVCMFLLLMQVYGAIRWLVDNCATCYRSPSCCSASPF